MQTVKLSSHYWNKSKDGVFLKLKILNQLPNQGNTWGNYQFEINNNCDECDYWLIFDSLDKPEKVKVPKENVILITTEEVSGKPYLESYQKQFPKIITSREDIHGDNVIKSYYCNLWSIYKSYDELSSCEEMHKSKNISIISSNLVRKPGHLDRYSFVNKLIGHFKDKIDVYGRGFNPIKDKYDALAPYKYSIAIENSSIHNYWTEKITDCYLSNTLPIYYGCPNLEEFFDKKSYYNIDIYDYKKSILQIEEIIDSDLYEESLSYIREAKNKILNKYQFFPWITKILDEKTKHHEYTNKTQIKIMPSIYYEKKAEFKTSFIKSLSSLQDLAHWKYLKMKL